MDWSVLGENAGLLARGLLVTLEVSALALVLALVLGVLVAFVCGVLALGVYTSAFVAEAIRSGILGVPRGQLEAGLSSGMRYATAMRTIVLPQAIGKTIPPLGNTALNLIKNSSLVSTVSVLDVLGTANLIGARTFQYVPMFAGAALCYLILTLPTAFAVNVLERRYAR